jgi:hypothetical protein
MSDNGRVKINLTFVGVPVSDLGVAQPWYERLLGREPDVLVSEIEVMWNLAGPSWLYIVRGLLDAGHARVVIGVDDLDDTIAELAGRDLQPRAIDVVPGAGSKYRFVDPDGNEVAFAKLPPDA